MTLSNTQQTSTFTLLPWLQSLLSWMFILTVCSLIVGFPLVILLVVSGALLSITLQSILSASAVLITVGSVVGGCLLAIATIAASLALRGIQPDQVSWLTWLHEAEETLQVPVYASCPLTCDLHPSS